MLKQGSDIGGAASVLGLTPESDYFKKKGFSSSERSGSLSELNRY